MKNILLQTKIDSLGSSNTDSISFSIWFWVALVEFAIIVFLFLKLNKNLNTKEPKINIMDDVMNDINKSKDLYKKLIRSCHPDRFQNKELKMKADEISKEISKNKRNWKKLKELEERAITELKIIFKSNKK